ncbi:MAG: hypothetical protein Fur0016_25000 [Anaerolineales bacterium]
MDDNPRFFEQPLTRALITFLVFVLAYFLINLLAYLWVWVFVPAPEEELTSIFTSEFFLGPVNNPFQQLTDALVCLIGLGAWLVFFAQFVLPVRTLNDRLKVVDRLVTYLMGGHGPAVFIENGIVRAKENEQAKKGPGLIWLDSASAAVLRTDSQFTEAIGPGVHFTNPGERIAGTADLHSLTQAVGPVDTDQGEADPFKVNKNHPDYEAIQARRWETSALTRDGIEVVAALSVTFHIAARPGEGNTRFGFNKETAQKAIRDSITRGADTSQPVWSELPARMAVDIWREYVRKFRQDELFGPVAGRSETGLQLISALVARRLKQPEIEQYDDFGRPILKPAETCQTICNQHIQKNLYAGLDLSKITEFFESKNFTGLYTYLLSQKKTQEAEDFLQKMPSREYKTLTDMGLEVQGVGLKRVIFPPEIEERLISTWTTTWKKNAEKERDQIDRNRRLSEIAGQEEAIKSFAVESTREFIFEPAPNRYETLFLLVRNTFRGARRNSALVKRLSSELRELSEMFNWLRDKGGRG